MTHATIPYYPLAVQLNNSNNFSYNQSLRPPISSFNRVKVVGPNVIISTNIVRSSYILNDQNPMGENIDGLIPVGIREIGHATTTSDITYLNVNLIENTFPAIDEIDLLFLFYNSNEADS